MDLITWKDEYRIGVPEIDDSHQELFRIINELYNAVGGKKTREEIRSFFDSVYELASDEFYFEELLMKEHRYEEYDAHRADHERLLQEIRGAAETSETGTSTGEEDINKVLAIWFGSLFGAHFRNHDAQLHRFLG